MAVCHYWRAVWEPLSLTPKWVFPRPPSSGRGGRTSSTLSASFPELVQELLVNHSQGGGATGQKETISPTPGYVGAIVISPHKNLLIEERSFSPQGNYYVPRYDFIISRLGPTGYPYARRWITCCEDVSYPCLRRGCDYTFHWSRSSKICLGWWIRGCGKMMETRMTDYHS